MKKILSKRLPKINFTKNDFSKAPDEKAANLFNNSKRLISENKIDEAFIILKELTKYYPKFAMGWQGLGIVQGFLADYESSIESYNSAINIAPEYAQAYFNLGNIFLRINRLSDAKKNFEICIKKEYNLSESYSKLSLIFFRSGDLDKSFKLAKKSIAEDEDSHNSYNILGNINLLQDNLNKAKDNYKKAINIDPYNKDYLVNMGNLLEFLNQKKEALKYLKKALEVDNNCSSAFRSIAHISEKEITNKNITDMEELFYSSKIDSDRINAGFGLWAINDRNKSYDKAFTFLKKANRIQFNKINHVKIEKYKQDYKKIRKNYNTKLFSAYEKFGYESDQSIFIIGMPRSGTTLVEQILSNHSEVYGSGEKNFISEINKKIQNSFNNDISEALEKMAYSNDIIKLAKEYCKKMSLLDKQNEYRFYTDKMPSNYIFIGLINILLPNSKIIHVNRNPLDTCLSIFSTLFRTGHDYSYDLKYLAQYYLEYEKLMEHWEKELPKKIYNIKYEDIIYDIESETKKLLDFCDLSFQKNCISFYNNPRSITTASSSQVRKELYNSSINKWKNYEDKLSDLINYLKPSL